MATKTFDEFCALTDAEQQRSDHPHELDGWWDDSDDNYYREVEELLSRPVDIEDLAALV
jgi:hypothetical protein